MSWNSVSTIGNRDSSSDYSKPNANTGSTPIAPRTDVQDVARARCVNSSATAPFRASCSDR